MNNSGINTVLLIILVIVAVLGLVWFLQGQSTEEKTDGVNIELNLPEDSNDQQ